MKNIIFIILISSLLPSCFMARAGNPLPPEAIKYNPGQILISKKTLALARYVSTDWSLLSRMDIARQYPSYITLPAGTRFRVVRIQRWSSFNTARGRSLYITLSCEVRGKTYEVPLPWHMSETYAKTQGYDYYDTVDLTIFRVVSEY